MSRRSLEDAGESFEVTLLEAARPARSVLFSVGAGGNPERHLPLLASLAEQGCSVVAPHFERLLSPIPTQDELLLRGRRLQLALNALARPDVPVAGLGHSIGSAMLIALAGGRGWTFARQPLSIDRAPRIERLALLAPATAFFQMPGALDAVRVPIRAWAGAADTVTPPAQAEFLKSALGDRVSVNVCVIEEAGHFSFMNTLPPQVTDSIRDRQAFLTRLASEVLEFVIG